MGLKRFLVSLMLTSLLGIPPLAAAHGTTLWAYVEKGKVFAEAFLTSGKKIADARIVIVNEEGTKLTEGKTDAEGKFSFTPKKKQAMTVILIVDDSHRGEFKIATEDFAEGEKQDEPVKKPEEKKADQ
jgi:nickel transport protein